MCGIIGIYNAHKASFLTYISLYSLQHRGQESCGIAVYDRDFKYYNSMGLVWESFSRDILEELGGKYSVGHVRYSTAGMSNIINSQPLVFNTKYGKFCIAHNGNIVNSKELKEKLYRKGSIFQTTTDSEIIAHLISHSPKSSFMDALIDGVMELKGAFSFIFMYVDRKKGPVLVALRDRWGFRPLVIGKRGNSWAFSSETCALDSIGYKYFGEVMPGEVVWVCGGSLKRQRYFEVKRFYRCIFEQVYFARPDSVVLGKTIAMTRYNIGRFLAREFKDRDYDYVSGVPDSGTNYAIGFSHESGIKFMNVFMKNHYSPRSFIQPNQSIREFVARLKLAPVRDFIKGKKIILIDDSIVRGTTSKKIIEKLRKCGAKKIALLIASPPIKGPCYYGIDTPRDDELIANRMSIKEIRDFIGVDELYYLTLCSLIKGCGDDGNFCTACFDRNYPIL
jgi:amidophosphoribosyltransferase